MTLTVLHSILGYLLSFRSDIIIPCFCESAINLWFSFLVCILFKTKSRLFCEDGFSCCGRGNTTRTCNTRFWRPLLYHLSYTPKMAVVVLPDMVLPEGFEPSKRCGLSALCLPISPEELMAGVAGFEPATHGLTVRCSAN